MFKSFIASALVPYAVLGASRGNADGSSAENALESFMIDNTGDGVRTYVYTWNEVSEDGKTRELHGETYMDTYYSHYPHMAYGFCMQASESSDGTNIFDCQQVNVVVSANEDGSKNSSLS